MIFLCTKRGRNLMKILLRTKKKRIIKKIIKQLDNKFLDE
jgi:hypothetical protein